MEPDLTRRPHSGRLFSAADMERLRDLYYDPAISVREVARAFGVPASTLLRWLAEMDWPRRTAAGPRTARAVWQGNFGPIQDVRAPDAAPEQAPALPDAGGRGTPRTIGVVSGGSAGQDGATPTLDPSPQGGGRTAPRTAAADLAARVLASAQAQIADLGDPLAPGRTPAEQNRRAALVASLSHTVDRVERALAVRRELAALRTRVRHLEKERRDAPKVAAMLTDVVRKLTAQLARARGETTPPPLSAQPERAKSPGGDTAQALAALTERLTAMAQRRS